MRGDMKTLCQAETEFQKAAHAAVAEKNLFRKAEHVDALIARLSGLVQVLGHEVRCLKNKVEGV